MNTFLRSRILRRILPLLILVFIIGLGAFSHKKPGVLLGAGRSPQAGEKKPNILFIMGDDIGWMRRAFTIAA
jgi:hypothetical protein